MNKNRSIRLRLKRNTFKMIAGADLTAIRAGDDVPAPGINSGGGSACLVSDGIHECLRANE